VLYSFTFHPFSPTSSQSGPTTGWKNQAPKRPEPGGMIKKVGLKKDVVVGRSCILRQSIGLLTPKHGSSTTKASSQCVFFQNNFVM